MTEEQKIVKVIQKHYDILYNQPDHDIIGGEVQLVDFGFTSLLLSKGIAIAYENLQMVLEACRKRGYGDLVEAFEAEDLINTEEKVRLIFEAHPDPIKFIAGLKEKAQLLKTT